MINQAGLDLIKSFEGLRLKAYKDSGDILTIGYGHTSDSYFKVLPGMVIDEAKATELLVRDIAEAEDTVRHQFLAWEVLNENQYAAIVSFVYNTGSLKRYDKTKKKFVDKTILEKLKRKNFSGVPEAFGLYIKDAKGNRLNGLIKRRAREKELFLRPTNQ